MRLSERCLEDHVEDACNNRVAAAGKELWIQHRLGLTALLYLNLAWLAFKRCLNGHVVAAYRL